MPPLTLTPGWLLNTLIAGLFLCLLLSATAPYLQQRRPWIWVGHAEPRRPSETESELWRSRFPSDTSSQGLRVFGSWRVGYGVTRIHRDHAGWLTIHESGWPLRAFRGIEWTSDPSGSGRDGDGWMFLVEKDPWRPIRLPCQPDVFAIAADAIVLGVIAAAARYLVVLRLARRLRSRGLCGRCKHILMNDHPCQECGLAPDQRPFRIEFSRL